MTKRIFALFLAVLMTASLLPLQASAAGDPRADAVSSATAEEEGSKSWAGNVLRKDVVAKTGGKVFGGKLYRKDITAVTFLDTLEDAPDNTFDVSEAKDGSVLAWANKLDGGYHLYIAGEGGVQAPENCSGLFCGYTNAESIDFNGNFHTENATTMSYMFSHCNSVNELDLSDFDTANVQRMECMFMHCYDITELDLTSFDVAKVFDMGSMFYKCSSLKYLDLSSFVSKDGRNTAYMFEKCPSDLQVNWGNGGSTGGGGSNGGGGSDTPTTPPADTPANVPSDVDGSYTVKAGGQVKIKGPSAFGSSYHLWTWEAVSGGSLVTLANTKSRECTITAKSPGTVHIRVTYEYSKEEPDVLTGIMRTNGKKRTEDYVIYIQ